MPFIFSIATSFICYALTDKSLLLICLKAYNVEKMLFVFIDLSNYRSRSKKFLIWKTYNGERTAQKF